VTLVLALSQIVTGWLLYIERIGGMNGKDCFLNEYC
jgi:hypothetical protein